jgi:enoyl-CoA hydratase/carnithine racemase
MASLPKELTSPPPRPSQVLLAFPKPHILLITLNRPDQLNAITASLHHDLLSLYEWYDSEPWLRCAVLTGTGRAFCAGADLKEWHERNNVAVASKTSSNPKDKWPATGGFGGLSNRAGKKPVIAAVNGLCLGGGMEMVINTDLVYASKEAKFGLPEVTRGVVAIAGALPRLVRTVGKQRASEMALIGKMYPAEQMLTWGLVNQVVPSERLMDVAVEAAAAIAGNSPDAVIVSREGLKSGWEAIGPQEATLQVDSGVYRKIDAGENMREGVLSFVEKRKAVWKDSKL